MPNRTARSLPGDRHPSSDLSRRRLRRRYPRHEGSRPPIAAVSRCLLCAVLAAPSPRPSRRALRARTSATSLPELWGVAAKPSFTATTFKRLRRAGINTVILDRRSLRPRQLARLSRRARNAHLRVLQPLVLPRRSTAADAQKACDSYRQAHPGSPCALFAPSYGAGLTLAESGAPDLVVVRLSGPGALRILQGPRSGRMVAVLSLRGPFKARAWRTAIRTASWSSTLDLAIAPRTATRGRSRGTWARSRPARRLPSDRKAPSTPTGLTLVEQTQLQLGARWQASNDNAAWPVTTSTSTGRSRQDDHDPGKASNLLRHIAQARRGRLRPGREPLGEGDDRASTSPCVLSPSDILPPSQPSGLPSPAGLVEIALSWGASVDNFGVAGYGVYRNNVLVGTTQERPSRVTGLDCGTLYDLAVDAYDYAGTRPRRPRSPRKRWCAPRRPASSPPSRSTRAPARPPATARARETPARHGTNWSGLGTPLARFRSTAPAAGSLSPMRRHSTSVAG